jgi:hypothetical protein
MLTHTPVVGEPIGGDTRKGFSALAILCRHIDTLDTHDGERWSPGDIESSSADDGVVLSLLAIAQDEACFGETLERAIDDFGLLELKCLQETIFGCHAPL